VDADVARGSRAAAGQRDDQQLDGDSGPRAVLRAQLAAPASPLAQLALRHRPRRPVDRGPQELAALRPTAFSDGQPYRRSAPALHAVTTPSASVATTASSRGAVDAETPPGHSSGAPCAASLGEGLVAT
jgi:hypothetical protein